ncbi:hypothetical protein POM88_032321 [Heracleum sosnowskyi]|uniref:Uncharacterized protein n=1 Tax=Heracleum sosnowskyi TaxID=360622 RepID=A0AAD8ML50_9APIA|nr:hypothetical protein POM88_032321 [Heracleum sosnowskyi]
MFVSLKLTINRNNLLENIKSTCSWKGLILAGASDGLVGSVDVAKRELLLECGLTTVGAVVAVRGKLGIIVLFKTGRESEWKDVGHGPYMLRGGCGEKFHGTG